MQFNRALLSIFIASSLITASPLDRSFFAKRQANENVVWVTVTSAYTVTLTNTLPQSTETITINAAQPVATTTTPTGDSVTPAPVIPTSVTSTPGAADPPTTDPVTTTSSSSDPPPPPAAAPTPVAGPSNSAGSGTMFSGQGTFFSPALGSCGVTSSDTDLICAIGHALYDSAPDGGNPNANPFCGRKIKAYSGSNSVTITVVDRCTGCQEYDLDFSPSAFDCLGSESQGRIPITWEFIS